MKEYFYCHADQYGQRKGTVNNIFLFDYEIIVKNGLLYYDDLFLYEDHFSALVAAQN